MGESEEQERVEHRRLIAKIAYEDERDPCDVGAEMVAGQIERARRAEAKLQLAAEEKNDLIAARVCAEAERNELRTECQRLGHRYASITDAARRAGLERLEEEAEGTTVKDCVFTLNDRGRIDRLERIAAIGHGSMVHDFPDCLQCQIARERWSKP